ncbi:MAG: zinc-dependent metalloprotease [Actinobacteria bacterium]|nr:zinc-dependent metalloprotease [Actinomycetota bacterium]
MTEPSFGDIPLFREIQRILAAGGEGPVNFEIARQIALAVIAESPRESPSPLDTRPYFDAIHPAELVVSGFTRLAPEEPARAKAVDQTEFVRLTLDGWRWLFEHMSQRFVDEMAKFAPEQTEGSGPLQGAMGPLAPLLFGMQVGTLVGHLAGESLGRHDPPLPRADDGLLFCVEANVARLAADYSFEPESLGRWLALQDVTRHVVLTSQPWIPNYFRSLLIEVVDAIEIDVSELQRRLIDLSSKGMEALGEGADAQGALPVVHTDRHRGAVERWNAFAAVLEGYCNSAAEAVADEVVGQRAKVAEGMARRGVTPSEGQTMLETLLGVSLDGELRSSGRTFCAAVLQLRGIKSLNRVWEAPDNLPAWHEVKDPFAWMDRVLGETDPDA